MRHATLPYLIIFYLIFTLSNNANAGPLDSFKKLFLCCINCCHSREKIDDDQDTSGHENIKNEGFSLEAEHLHDEQMHTADNIPPKDSPAANHCEGSTTDTPLQGSPHNYCPIHCKATTKDLFLSIVQGTIELDKKHAQQAKENGLPFQSRSYEFRIPTGGCQCTPQTDKQVKRKGSNSTLLNQKKLKTSVE